MPRYSVYRYARLSCLTFTAWMLLACGLSAQAQAQVGNAAEQLRLRYDSRQQGNGGQGLLKGVNLQSQETEDRLSGEVYVVLAYPLAEIQQALTTPSQWCDVLILQLNVQYCRAAAKVESGMDVALGRKHDEALSSSHWAHITLATAPLQSGYFSTQMSAPTGPMGTRDYRLTLEAAAWDSTHTLMQVSYAFGYGVAARWAVKAYLATVGRDKVGFTAEGRLPDGTPAWNQGTRAMVERNTVRFYLALESYLNTQKLPPEVQQSSRLQLWYAATERYPRQLHELSQEAYISTKVGQIERQRSTLPIMGRP